MTLETIRSAYFSCWHVSEYESETFFVYIILLKCGSLDNAIQEFSLA